MKLSGLRSFCCLLSLCGLGTSTAMAQSTTWTHEGLRPLGMGNAFVSVADDYNAIFYNPAGLARLKSWDGEFLNPHFKISANSVELGSEIYSLVSGAAGDNSEVLDLIESQIGKTQGLAIGWTPHFIVPGFGLAIGAELGASLAFYRDPSIYVDFGPTVIIPMAFAMNFLEDRLSIGLGIKGVARGGLQHEFSMSDLQSLGASQNKEKDGSSTEETEEGPTLDDFVVGGFGYGADFGLLFTPIKTMSPTLGLSIADVGGTKYEKFDISGSATAAPKSRLPAVNVGFSLKPYTSDMSYLLAAIDVHQTNQPIHFSKKLNMGLEYGLGKQLFKLQMGLHQGWLTGGFQFDVGLLNLKFISYSEELSAVAGGQQDRKYALQFKLII